MALAFNDELNSYTGVRRARLDFGKRIDTLQLPPLLDIQLDSYKKDFLQEDVPADKQDDLSSFEA